MARRKVQLIAGKTFAVSLPKTWALRQGLRQSDELSVTEQDDGSLLLSMEGWTAATPTAFTVPTDRYNVEHVLLTLYYLGAQTITLRTSDNSREFRARVRRTVAKLSGMELEYEDPHELRVVVLLEEQRVDLHHLLYRLGLLIEQSFTLLADANRAELALNEEEADRLYHLAIRVLSRSLERSSILASSGVSQLFAIPYYFLIAKKLEGLMDVLAQLGVRPTLPALPPAFVRAIRHTLDGSLRHLLKRRRQAYRLAGELATAFRIVEGVDRELAGPLRRIATATQDVEGAVFAISFSRRMRETVKKG